MLPRIIWLFVLLALGAVAAPLNVDREIVLTPISGQTPEDREVSRWQQRAGAANATVADFERLGWAFVAKARRSVDAGFFDLALRTAAVADAQFGASDGIALLRGHALHNLHRFREAEIVARQLATTRGTASDFALLSDALMEQGRFDEAVAALQHAADLKPGAEIDVRIAHLRWLKGDLAGAVFAMETAIRETALTEHEPLAWMMAQLAAFELERGDLARADAFAAAAEKHLPDFPPALLAEGRVALARNDAASAVGFLRRAAELNPLPDYRWWFADALRASGEVDEAVAVERRIVATGETTDPRTTALFLATTRAADAATALKLAEAELGVRGDVQTHDALAWAAFRAGDQPRAVAEARQALALGTRDSRLLLHGALILRANGQNDAAGRLFVQISAESLRPSERSLLHGVWPQRAAASVAYDVRFSAANALCHP